jgi:threonine synthase
VAQAAMIGNPVSMPRVIHLVDRYNQTAGQQRVFFIEVAEQDIMDWEIIANRNGHIACTHGGESLAGLVDAVRRGVLTDRDVAVVKSTAHALKFAEFQEMYFQQQFPPEYNVQIDTNLVNAPVYVHPEDLEQVPAPGKPLSDDAFDDFVCRVSQDIAGYLKLKKR